MVLVDTFWGSMTRRDGRIAELPIFCPTLKEMLAGLVATLERRDLKVILQLKEGVQFGQEGEDWSEEFRALHVRVTGLEVDRYVASGDRFLFTGIIVFGGQEWMVEGRANPRTKRARIIKISPRQF